MRQLTVWFVALGSIAVLIISWTVTAPIGGRLADYFNENTDYSDNPLAQDAYDTHNNMLIWGRRSLLLIGVGIFLIWAMGSMQRTEEYSGVYR